jgi:hypothetical protein
MCGASRLMSQDEIAHMMANGYPRCCGYRMRIDAIK